MENIDIANEIVPSDNLIRSESGRRRGMTEADVGADFVLYDGDVEVRE